MYSLRQVKAIEKANKEKWLRLDPRITDESGIYVLCRTDENGIRYAYVGQAKHILTRLAQHLTGYQHIDLSIKKHKLWAENNIYGWDIKEQILCKEEMLDEIERYTIKKYAEHYQLRNKTAGGQDKGKTGINDNAPAKGYYDGKKQGYKDCKAYVKKMFEKYLFYSPKPNKIAERKFNEFTQFLQGEEK